MKHYKAEILCMTEEDNFEQGIIGDICSQWEITEKAGTIEKLIEQVEIATDTLSKDWELYEEEYRGSAIVDNDNVVASDSELEEWKKGNMKLYCMDCYISFSEVVETPRLPIEEVIA